MRNLSTGFGVFALLWAFGGASAVHADGVVTGYYFKVQENDPDFGRGVDGGPVQGLVANTLGPDGLPVVTPFGRTYMGGSGPITQVNSKGELLWWSAGATPYVSVDKVSVDALPLNFPNNFYPTGQTNDLTYFRSVHWEGTFVTPASGQITLSLGSDDDSWVFIDGKLAIDDGGVKGLDFVPNTITGLSAGTHTIDIFYDDRYPTDAGIEFNSSVTLSATPVPEPGGLSLALVVGLVGFGAATWRRWRHGIASVCP